MDEKMYDPDISGNRNRENYVHGDRLGRNARAEVVAKYTWDIHVDRILGKLGEYT